MQGSSSRLAGVELRREVQGPDGTWDTTGTTRAGSDGRWGDTFASAHGDLVRYVAPGSGARLTATTTPVAVDGSWTPSVSTTTTSGTDGVVTVTGSAPGLPGGTAVERQVVLDAVWTTEATVRARADGSFEDSFVAVPRRQYRYHVVAAPPRREAVSQTYVAPARERSPSRIPPQPRGARTRIPPPTRTRARTRVPGPES